jgi:3-(3-hydroxy-phenyl)propionate hydroxylase
VTAMQRMAVQWGGVVQTADARVGRARDRLLEGLDRIGVAGWVEDRAKPLPTYGAGAFAATPHRLPWRRTIGSLFPQPTIADGTLLDDRLGRGWAGVATSPVAAHALRSAGLATVQTPRLEWLERRGLAWALLRPDRFVFDCGTGASGAEDVAVAAATRRSLLGAAA